MLRLRSLSIVAAIVVCIFVLGSRAQGSTAATSADGVWRDVAEAGIAVRGQRDIIPARYRTVAATDAALSALLQAAPLERTPAAQRAPVTLLLPLPYGGFGRFHIEASPVMAPGLAAQFPAITTYIGQGIDDPTATARLDRTPSGFHAQVITNDTTWYVDPYSRGDTTHYLVYDKRDYVLPPGKAFQEGPIQGVGQLARQDAAISRPSGDVLHTYRLVVAATGEYTAFHGGTVAVGQAAIVTSVNRVVGVYEREVSVRLVLVANNNTVVYTDAATDPYTNAGSEALLGQNQTNLDAVIGTANYDIGHVFSTGAGGVAFLGSVCDVGDKARGVTGIASPIGDAFDIDYVAHEMGHQFGGNHTFNGTTSNCGGGNRVPGAAYEPGSGSTIMAYAGICGDENVQPSSDAYFHAKSYDEIIAFVNNPASGGSCDVETATGNTAPVVNAGTDYTIPANTPFELTGTSTDANSDPVTYNWEQFDLGAAAPPNTDNGNRPILRSFNSTTSPSRTFPQLPRILNDANIGAFGESLPATNRTLNFRLTVRDNRAGGGGVNSDSIQVAVVADVGGAAVGPFVVNNPNGAITWTGGSTRFVGWDVANTAIAPVNCAAVNVLLSTDDGLTFPTTLLISTPNDGEQGVLVPNSPTTSARIKVQCATSVFFDIGNANFTILGGTPVPTVTGTPPTATPRQPTPTNTPAPTNTPSPTPIPVGGPDAFGYCFRDTRTGGQTYSFTDISTSGTALTFGSLDDDFADAAIPFDFNFYGTPYTSMRVLTNGFVRFGTTSTGTGAGNEEIPASAAPNNLIAPFWDDLVLNTATSVRTQTVGTTPNRTFIVQWTDMTAYDSADTLSFTFQMRLSEGSNEINFAYYLNGVPPAPPTSVGPFINGDSATVGIENATGSTGLQYSFDTARLDNGLLIRFSPICLFPQPPATATMTNTATRTNTATTTRTATTAPTSQASATLPPTATATTQATATATATTQATATATATSQATTQTTATATTTATSRSTATATSQPTRTTGPLLSPRAFLPFIRR